MIFNLRKIIFQGRGSIMGKKVLVADDATVIRVMLKNILAEAGYEVVGEAANGAEAVSKYKELHPDLVTMDITMPEMDGINALRNIRTNDPSARVVMCSAMGQKNLVLEAIQAGAKNFIVKPFDRDKVLEVVAKVLA